MASGARETIKEEAGVDLDAVDWKKLDPRQYDPRRIIREALLDDDDDSASSSAAPAISTATAGTAGLASGAAANYGHAIESKPITRLVPGQPAPWDAEAT